MLQDVSIVGAWVEFKAHVIDVVTRAVRDVIKKGNEDQGGGYFTLLYQETDDLVIPPELIGEVTNGKGGMYVGFAKEKAYRLSRAHDQDEGHILSWQSGNPAKERWGGAVLVKDSQDKKLILSFSGLSELADEAAMLLTAVRLGLLSMKEAKDIAFISSNLLFMEREW